MLLPSILAFSVGAVLGLLGGGGSILMVPLLVYGLAVPAKEAIATSLVVVGLTAAAALLPHARAGRVRWRVGLLFAASGSVGAWLGGFAAAWFSATTLLMLFAALMVATSLAMLRDGPSSSPTPKAASTLLTSVVGLGVGAFAGLVGAGGGFLVVPALTVLGGLSVREAVGTSLLVIALNSGAGYAGHATHVSVDWELIGVVASASGLGSLVGGRWSERVPAPVLRKVFALFVLAMAGFLVWKELTPAMFDAVFVQPWPFWAGGVAIGLIMVLFALFEQRLFGVSTGYEDACSAISDPKARTSWRFPLMAGIVAGGAVAAVLSGAFHPSFAMGQFDRLFSASLAVKLPVFVLGGIFVGFGARLAGGCTSGHSIVGTSLQAPSSLLSTAAFLAAGFVTTNALLRGLGGL